MSHEDYERFWGVDQDVERWREAANFEYQISRLAAITLIPCDYLLGYIKFSGYDPEDVYNFYAANARLPSNIVEYIGKKYPGLLPERVP